MADATRPHGIHTTAIHAGEAPDSATGALVPPIHLATTYHLGTAENSAAIFGGEKDAFVYTRWANPTVAAFERKAAALERGEGAVATASGMARPATMKSAADPPRTLRAANHPRARKMAYIAPTVA